MADTTEERINVIIAMDFSNEIMEQLQNISPRLNIEQHFPEVPASAWSKAEILFTGQAFPEPDQAPLLRWIQLHYAGVEKALNKRIIQAEDVEVTTASGIHATQIANYCLMMMLAFNYRLLEMMASKEQKKWIENQHELYSPIEMKDQTVGIVGYGSIGRELARLANEIGMTVLASKQDVMRIEESGAYTEPGTGDPTGNIPERIYPGQAMASMAKDCDYLVVTTPLTDKTRHLINEATFEAMKPTAILINISRGSVVDEAALISALAAEKIRGAALDVFEEEPLATTSPLWNLDNVIISPHVAGNVANYHEKVAALFTENLQRYLDNEPLLNVVDREKGY